MTIVGNGQPLIDAEIQRYGSDGYVVVRDCLGLAEVDRVRAEVERLYQVDHPGRVFEKDGRTIRGIHGSHQVSDLFARLVRLPQLLSSAERLLGGKLYVHQCKVNAKRALTGDVWPWHQDYLFWQQKDGMRKPRSVNVALFLDEATEYSGPLLVMPGSHRQGTIDADRWELSAGEADWTSAFSANLDLALDIEQLVPLVDLYGIQSVTGPAGSLLFFDPQIVHGSGANMSPYDRGLALITYNRVDNPLAEVANPRPDFLAARNYEPLNVLTGSL